MNYEIRWAGNIVKPLNKLAETSSEFANKMFANIYEHIVGQTCDKCTFTNCKSISTIEYNGEIKRACGGAIQFKWLPSEFEDVRKVIAAVHQIVKITDENKNSDIMY